MNEAALLMPAVGVMPSPDGGAASRLDFGQKVSASDRFSGMLREQRSVVESSAAAKPAGNQTGRKGGETPPPSGNDLPEPPSAAAANTNPGGAASSTTGSESETPATEPPLASDSSDVDSQEAAMGLVPTAVATVAQPLGLGLPITPNRLKTSRSQALASVPTQSGDAARLSRVGLPGGASQRLIGVADGSVSSATTLTGGERADSLSPVAANLASLQGSAPGSETVSAGIRPLSAGARLALARTGLFTAEGAANRTREGEALSINGATGRPPVGPLLMDLGPPPTMPTAQPGSPQGVLQQGIGNSLFKLSDSTDFTGLTATSREFSTNGDFGPVVPSSLTTTASPRLAGVPVLNVATFAGQPGWSNELGQRVSWMVGNQLREAQLQLHPRSLGPVEVRIAFGAEQQLSVNFSATNAVAREALEAALPRLREMFDQQGLNLGQADVSRESFAEQRRRREQDDSLAAASGGRAESLVDGSLAPHSADLVVNIAEGLLDAYA
ncbi:MAG: hypothetical protein GXP17_09060 [Gammaproteobacteria bacterium]|nr:hypothetical protein [Gammaproteobacteria bacterium]